MKMKRSISIRLLNMIGVILLTFFLCPIAANAQKSLTKAIQEATKVKPSEIIVPNVRVVVTPKTTLKDITTVTGTKQSKVQIRDIKPFLENSRIAPLVLELNRSLDSKLPTRNNEHPSMGADVESINNLSQEKETIESIQVNEEATNSDGTENVEEDSESDDSSSTPQNLQQLKETIQMEWYQWMQKQIEEAPSKNYRIGREKIVQLIIYDNYEYSYAA